MNPKTDKQQKIIVFYYTDHEFTSAMHVIAVFLLPERIIHSDRKFAVIR